MQLMKERDALSEYSFGDKEISDSPKSLLIKKEQPSHLSSLLKPVKAY